MSAYGAIPREPVDLQPSRIYALKKRSDGEQSHTHMVCVHLRKDDIPNALEEAMRTSYNETLIEGSTYPFRDPMDKDAFQSYFFGYDVVVGVLVNASGQQYQDGSEVSLAELLGQGASTASRHDLLGKAQWPQQLGGFYYVKPNYPGRSSHICNAGFIVPTSSRGLGLGGLLGRSYLIYGPAFGYLASVFNLVYLTNLASAKIWERLGFEVVGRVPKAGLLRVPGTDKEEYVDALVIYKEFAPH